jgi:putative transcriptional regulator
MASPKTTEKQPDAPSADVTKTPSMEDVVRGQKMKAAREAAGLTQGRLSKETGLDVSTLSRIELGKHAPNRLSRLVIERVLGLPEDGLATPSEIPRVGRSQETRYGDDVVGEFVRRAEALDIPRHAIDAVRDAGLLESMGMVTVETLLSMARGAALVRPQGDRPDPEKAALAIPKMGARRRPAKSRR